jgi:hypothetical protein
MTRSKRVFLSRLVRRHWCILLCVLAIFGAVPALTFAAQLTGTFTGYGPGRKIEFSHNGKAQNDWAGVLKFKIDNGPEVSVFCIQIDVRVHEGDRYRSDGPVLGLPNGCQIRYLLDKYPASTAKDADEAAARQMAIWVFSDNVDPTTIADAKVRDRTIALVNEAKDKPCPSRRTEAPDLTIEPPTANAAAGQTVAYTVRASAQDAGQSVTVSVNGPAVMSDANGTNSGQQQQNVTLDGQSAATFWVLSTGAGQTTVNASLPYRLEVGTVFSQLDQKSPSQRLVMAESQDLVANASAQATWAAGAPAPSPSATAEQPSATAPSPSATAEQPSATAAAPAAGTPAPATATPTSPPPRRRSKPSSTEQPTATAEQPTATAVAGEEATATPQSANSEETAPAAPTAAPPGNEQAAATPSATPAQPAGGAPTQPRSLPNTGEPAGPAIGLLLVGMLALLLGGWIARRLAIR